MWEHINQQLPASERQTARRRAKPESVLREAEGALATLASEWKKTFEAFQQAGLPVPPVMIVVCDNTDLAKLVHEHIASSRVLKELENRPGQEVTFRLLGSLSGVQDEKGRIHRVDQEGIITAPSSAKRAAAVVGAGARLGGALAGGGKGAALGSAIGGGAATAGALMAKGLHLNYYQFLHHNRELLITPNEGLSEQHLRELELSGIPARRFDLNQSGLFRTPNEVQVIEITKLQEYRAALRDCRHHGARSGTHHFSVRQGKDGRRNEMETQSHLWCRSLSSGLLGREREGGDWGGH